ncbi:uncharacterized protein TNCV_1021541 [Trichonephila clavipes]|uniref:Mos1 transposase HTH domain-containing protein n=1 Tax=Trichonephila clavipes TaxID=2585209 RepID=A0A8X6VIU1_TRICX|nr:uncharacterized protein TNCV_1021541 [Trichonephila clavipes]
MRDILYEGTLARNPWCSRRRRIDEEDISTTVEVDQRAANCLEEAVWLFAAIRSRCRSSRTDVTFHRSLPVFRVVRCSSVHCFQTHITMEHKIHELLLRDRKADNPPPFKLRENASQVTEIVNGVYGAKTVTANYVQFWLRRFRSGIFDVKDAPSTGRPVVENVDKIPEIIELDWHVSSHSIT